MYSSNNFSNIPTMREKDYYELIVSQSEKKGKNEYLNSPLPSLNQNIEDLSVNKSLTDNILYYIKKQFYNYDNMMTIRIILLMSCLYMLEKLCGSCITNLKMEYKIILLIIILIILFNLS